MIKEKGKFSTSLKFYVLVVFIHNKDMTSALDLFRRCGYILTGPARLVNGALKYFNTNIYKQKKKKKTSTKHTQKNCLLCDWSLLKQ